jgi:hypothetical protein
VLSRAKGVLNAEINRLSAVGRNQQAEVESLGRQLADQERLLGEKLKEIEKETEKMSKNEIKKTL